jgi:hypothetical protein
MVEYKKIVTFNRVVVNEGTINEKLEEYGADGWELAAAFKLDQTQSITLVFQRSYILER